MSWKIFPLRNQRQFSDEVNEYSKELALAQALKQPAELQDADPNYI